MFVCVYLNLPATFKCLQLGRVSEIGKASPFTTCEGEKRTTFGVFNMIEGQGIEEEGRKHFYFTTFI